MMAMRTYGWGHHRPHGRRLEPQKQTLERIYSWVTEQETLDFSEESGLLETNSTALSATWVDYDNDGDLDLYQSNYGITLPLLQVRLI